MPAAARLITRDDILSPGAYEQVRAERRQAVIALKRDRRLAIGPYITAHFENYDTMWMQVHEMLRIEKGGEGQIAGELAAYNSLIPQGRELVATVMVEIDDERLRRRLLARLGRLEYAMSLEFAGISIAGVPEDDVERTTLDGKTSAVHFIHFPFRPEHVTAFRTRGTRVQFVIDHPDYGHAAILPEATRAALAEDFA